MVLSCNLSEDFMGADLIEAKEPVFNIGINTQGDEEDTSLAGVSE
jgi:hypothetical protein